MKKDSSTPLRSAQNDRLDPSTPLRSAQNDSGKLRSAQNGRADRNGYGPALIPWEDRGCFVCGRKDRPLQRHEVFHGPYRSKSKRYGCWAPVCDVCHERIHRDAGLERKMKWIFQRKAMQKYGWSMEQWREVFGKNYLETPPSPAAPPPLSGEAKGGSA